MKTLILLDHPNYSDSVVNRKWIEEIEKYPEEFTVRILQDHIKDSGFNIAEEQKIVEGHDSLVLQFPIYWFSCPSVMKKWLDEVVSLGWAFGEGDEFLNKKIAIGASFGVSRENLSRNGSYRYSPDEIFIPFETSCTYAGAKFVGYHGFYGAEHDPKAEDIEANAKEYVSFLRNKLSK